MKSLNKKPLLLIGGIFLAILLIIIIVACVRSCSKPGSNYESVESQMVNAARNYFTSEGHSLPKEFESEEVSVTDLVNAGKMSALSKKLSDKTCTGSVKVYNQGGQYLYSPNLECSEYTTKHLKDVIIENQLVTNQSNETTDYVAGLYNVNDIYVFRGKNPKNYVSFGGILWRIIDINAEGLIRIVKVDAEQQSFSWDNKFNSDANKTLGINDYKNSAIRELMYSEYKKFKDESKLHLAPYDVCIGKRDGNEVDADRSIDCSEVLENQYIGLINSADIALASLDSNCEKITGGACSNYNYLYNTVSESWTSTALKGNTYDVVYINGGNASAVNAIKMGKYHWVIAINGNELYKSGDGTSTNPYLVGSAS